MLSWLQRNGAFLRMGYTPHSAIRNDSFMLVNEMLGINPIKYCLY